MKKIYKQLLLFISVATMTACSDTYLDTAPTSSTSTQTIFETTVNAKLAINGIAKLMVSQYQYYGQNFCGEGTVKFLYGEYLGENFSRPNLTGWSTLMNGNYLENSSSIYNNYVWFYYYELIGNANSVIANIDNAEGSESERNFIKAQALTYRAYAYTQLIQFYCYRWADSNNGTEVSKRNNGLVLRTEENMTERDIPLSSASAAYAQVYKDLDEAIQLFSSSSEKRSDIWEPNIDVANAVYARAALYRQDYSTAVAKAAAAREGYKLMSNKEYFDGFSASNDEWIWGSYGGDDQTLYYYGFHSYMGYDSNTSMMRTYPVCISKELYEKIPKTDVRRDLFLDGELYAHNNTNGNLTDATEIATVKATHPNMLSSHNVAAYESFKFSIGGSIGVGYVNQFRAAEMYLIEAEAKYYLNDEAGAKNALVALIKDSGRDAEYECTTSGADLLKEIKTYRAIELWGEGFDWIDKKRYNEPIVRKSFADGGSFATAMSVSIEPNRLNKWTYFTPQREYDYNHALD